MSAGKVIENEILDAIDSSPIGTLEGEVPYTGPVATVQSLSRSLALSESVIYRAVLRLFARGLVEIVNCLDPVAHCRRLFIIGEAR